MTVRDLIKRLEKIDKDKMCIHREFKDSIGWSNLGIKEKENEAIKINNEGTIEYINSSYIMYYELD